MNKINLSLITLAFTLLSCNSVRKKEIKNSSKTYETFSLQEQVEKNIYRINENNKSDSIPTTIERRMSELNIPGISIAVFDNNKILWKKGFGIKDKTTGERVNENTIFQAASISKPVACALAFKLIENGKIILDENVNIKLKRWQIPENKFTIKEKVTPRRIMSHTSGLSTSGFRGYNKKDTIPTLTQILKGGKTINSEPVRVFQKPGTSKFYSGGAMQVLQLLMEDVSNQNFSKLTKDLIFKPIGMKSSSFDYPLPERINNLTTHGYDSSGNVIEGGYFLYPEKAAAGLWSTPSDLALFMIALGKSYRGEDGGLLKQSSAQLMMKRVPNAGGTGIGLDGTGAAFRFRHTGVNAGFRCYVVSFADKGRGLVIMTNSDNGFPLIHEITRAISKVYNWPALWMEE
ncbi:serine hydrolase domain-containing protein [Zhouia amylolytica]|uniref:Beta-lactamase n=1 Tax=Zhouia amylolytica AD3 TaxID=1286632 RepID=W2URY6_9FLAO|nr:serine hydrolase domain-containing protein [Zhouia amylolytica]ETN96236.1 beta-lactamase [Zhouia amylolytica AD3]